MAQFNIGEVVILTQQCSYFPKGYVGIVKRMSSNSDNVLWLVDTTCSKNDENPVHLDNIQLRDEGLIPRLYEIKK